MSEKTKSQKQSIGRQEKFNGEKKVKREQPRKDSKRRRVNFDNTRATKFEKDLKDLYARGDSNDIRWYSKSPARIQAAGRLPFSSINGLTVIGSDANTSYAVPAIIHIGYAPNFLANQTVVEQAYQNAYSDIVHANSRNQQYDYTDLAIMMNAGTEVFAAIASGIRVYGIMKRYQEQNVYYPDTIIKALGFDPIDLRSNYAHMWDDLLQLIAQSRQIWIPNTMPIVERRLWMNLNIYADSPNDRAQLYAYVQEHYYKYVGYTDKKGGKLSKIDLEFKDVKWSNYISMIQSMIDALIPDQDRGIMYGDVLKAYGSQGIFAMNEIDLNYQTQITYNQEVLWQIENLTHGESYPVELYQDNLHLYQSYSAPEAFKFAAGSNKNSAILGVMYPQKALLNFHQTEQPTPEQITIATRMVALGSKVVVAQKYNSTTKVWENDTKSIYIPEVAGTEICCSIYIYSRMLDRATNKWNVYATKINNTSIANTGYGLMAWVACDWAPNVYVYNDTTISSPTKVEVIDNDIKYVLCDFDNYSYAYQPEIGRLHDAVIFSLYNVPTL